MRKRFFHTPQPCGQPNLIHNGQLCSPSGTSWSVLGWTLPLPYPYRHHTVMWMHESLIKYQSMKTRESMELYLHKILNLALDRLEWLVSSSTCFNHRARAPPYHWVGCCVGPRNNMNTINTMEYNKIPCHCQEANSLVLQPTALSKYCQISYG